MARIRLTTDGVTAGAMVLIDEHGYHALSLSAVAEGLGVGPSALYSHVDGLDGLREVVAIEATRRLTEAVRNAAIGNSGDDAIRAVAQAYRSFAVDHPARFEATVQVRHSSPGMDHVRAELDAVFSLLSRARGLREPQIDFAARHLRSAIHGFLVLQVHGRDPAHADADYEALIDGLCRTLVPDA